MTYYSMAIAGVHHPKVAFELLCEEVKNKKKIIIIIHEANPLNLGSY